MLKLFSLVTSVSAVILDVEVNERFDDFFSDEISPLYKAQVITAN